jgi:hypothetical protein
MSDEPNKVNKALEIAKLVNGDVQSLMLKMFAQAECTDQLKAENPAAYFEKSNHILAAIVGCASQMALGDGLPRYKLSGKLATGARTAWDLFLHNNPSIAEKVMAEKAAKEAAYATQTAFYGKTEGDEDEDTDEDEDA